MILAQTAQNTAAGSSSNVALVSDATTIQIDDSTAVQSSTWSSYKATAMAEGFLSSSITDATEKALVDALIAAQDALGLAPLATSPAVTHVTAAGVSVDLTDATTVGGEAWSTLKTRAVLSTYDNSALSSDDQLLLAALIAAQNAIALPALTSTPYATGNPYTDDTIIASVTWADFKAVAMLAGFSDTDLSPTDKILVAALIQAQQELDSSWTLTPVDLVIGGDDLSDATVVAGKTWVEHKTSAVDTGYRNKSRYLAMSTADKALIDFLIDAQAAQGDDLPLKEVDF